MKKKTVIAAHPCQMDEAAGAIRGVYRPRKCCGARTQHYVLKDGKKYYLCPVHMAASGFLDMGDESPDFT